MPSEGKVTWFVGSRDDVKESVQVKLAVGQSYRLKLSDMPEFPGIELYPSIELLDQSCTATFSFAPARGRQVQLGPVTCR